jgi:hypothetical protein
MVVQSIPANADVESDSKTQNPNISKIFFMLFPYFQEGRSFGCEVGELDCELLTEAVRGAAGSKAALLRRREATYLPNGSKQF